MSAAAMYASEAANARQTTANSQHAANQNAPGSLTTVTATNAEKPGSAVATDEAAKQGAPAQGQADNTVKQPRTYKEIKQRLQQL